MGSMQIHSFIHSCLLAVRFNFDQCKRREYTPLILQHFPNQNCCYYFQHLGGGGEIQVNMCHVCISSQMAHETGKTLKWPERVKQCSPPALQLQSNFTTRVVFKVKQPTERLSQISSITSALGHRASGKGGKSRA